VVSIFFSLFSSPAKAYGSVSGEFELELPVEKGRAVAVLENGAGDWFSGSLLVETVSRVPGQDRLLVGLRDIVAPSAEEAARLGTRFEKEAGLFCDIYD
jgi:hypothetical protein